MTKKPGRNDPCHCGSGKKYKKCHLPIEESLPQALELMAEKRREQIEYEKKFGKARPMMGAELNGYKFVVEGSKIHYSKEVKTPADFLDGYLKQVLGKDWWQTECKKEQSKRHPIVRWAFRKFEHQKPVEPEDDGICKTEFVWPMWQYFMLARDLHVIRDHSAYEKKILTGLRREEHFLGSRNELFAASTLIRAGFKIEWEDSNGKGGKKPVEFNATSIELNETVAVECKARNVLSQEPNIGPLLNDAFLKDASHPLVIFIDLLVPPFTGDMITQPWHKSLMDAVTAPSSRDQNGKEKYSLIIVTNHWADPMDDKKTDFYQDFLHIVPTDPLKPFRNSKTVPAIVTALQQFGTIPNDFV